MKRVIVLSGLVALLAACQPGTGAEPRRGMAVLRIPAYGSKTFVQSFKAGERAVAIVTGQGDSYLGLYVFDADGNCVAQDDRSNFATRDDAAVEWYPPRAGRYTIEVRNLTANTDVFAVMIRQAGQEGGQP